MSNAKSRRDFFKTGAAITAGMALGAFTAAGLAGEPKAMAANTFLDRYDKRIAGAELGELLVGHTMMGVTYKGREYLAYFAGGPGGFQPMTRIDLPGRASEIVGYLENTVIVTSTTANGPVELRFAATPAGLTPLP